MKSLYNTYESLYHGILDTDFDNRLKDSDKAIDDIINSYKERFIKIMSFACSMTDIETLILRKTITELQAIRNDNFMLCYIPAILRDMLIKLSNRKLTKHDFDGFSTDKKEYEFATSMEWLYLERADNTVTTDLRKFKKLPKNKWHNLKGGIQVIVLGDAVIFKRDTLLYFYINNIYRLPFRLVNNHSNKHSRPLY